MRVHTDPDKGNRNPGVLAYWPMTLCCHTRIDEDLRHRVLGRRRFFFQVGLVQCLDVIDRVVVADVLECIGD